MRSGSCVLVTGATNQIGHFLLPRLSSAGFDVIAISRTPKPAATSSLSGVRWKEVDLTAGFDIDHKVDCLIHTAGAELLPGIIDRVASLGVKRIIAFSTTSIFVKHDSGSRIEKKHMERIIEAEREIEKESEQRDIDWTIFRPTLVYGCGLDRNVTAIRNFIRRYGFFVIAGAGAGLRQPVHADDLASACVTAMENDKTFNRAYNLSGAETLTYRRMVEKIFESEGKKPRIIAMPLSLLRLGLRVLSVLPSYDQVTSEMADRMSRDLCFDHSDATRDFGYSPAQFTP